MTLFCVDSMTCHICMCVCACVRACVRACMHACVCMYVCLDFSAAFLCRCRSVHVLLFVLVTINRIHIHRFDRRPENLKFNESADGRPPNFVKGVNCCPCLGFFTQDVILWVCVFLLYEVKVLFLVSCQ